MPFAPAEFSYPEHHLSGQNKLPLRRQVLQNLHILNYFTESF